jgi:hypothetical protein
VRGRNAGDHQLGSTESPGLGFGLQIGRDPGGVRLPVGELVDDKSARTQSPARSEKGPRDPPTTRSAVRGLDERHGQHGVLQARTPQRTPRAAGNGRQLGRESAPARVEREGFPGVAGMYDDKDDRPAVDVTV